MPFTKRHLELAEKEMRGHLKAAREVVDRAENAHRDLTDEERAVIDHHLTRAKELRPQVDKLKASHDEEMRLQAAFNDTVGGIGMVSAEQRGSGFGGAYQPAGAKANPGRAWGKAIIRENSDSLGRFKALTPAGGVLVAVPQPQITPMGQPLVSLRQLIPSEKTEGAYSFLRQTTRTNNAAPVAAGGLKPTSVYETELVEGRAATIAHLTQPIPRQDLADADRLEEFVASELFHGWERAVEDQILNGDGTGANMTGVAATSGVLTQAYSTSLIVTTRKSVTALENQGITGTGWVLNPTDWESIELAATTAGSLLMAEAGGRVPIESAAKRLWGYPVVTTPVCPAGTGYFADWNSSTRLFVREEVNLSWSENTYDPDALGAGVGASDFARNLIRYRAEGRIGFGVLRPSGIVKLDLTP